MGDQSLLDRASAAAAEHANVTVSINPATLEKLGHVDNTDLTRLPAMFAAARSAQALWAQQSFAERASHIKKMRDYIVANAEELASIVARDNGKSRVDALATEVLPCALACNWYMKNAAKVLKPKSLGVSSILFFNKRSQVMHVPMGVVGIISPWNYPLSIPFGELVMGLMAGNAIMLKVAAQTPLVGKAIEAIVAAGELPVGLFHHVVGSGGAVSTAFFKQHIDKLFFTGSVATGKQLMAQAAENLTPLSLELGGNDPMIVLADADLERAANGAAWAGYQNAGQSCGGVARIYVDRRVHDQFVTLLAEKTRKMRHGVDTDFELEMGAMTTHNQLKVVERHVQDALDKGARIAAQSSAKGPTPGYFFPATLLTNVHDDMLTMKEETFGPVMAVVPFDSEEEAIRKANNSDLGLTSSVWTRNQAKGKAIAARLETGVTAINDHLYTHGLSETPWGGWKLSGIGRTHGAHGLAEMTHTKVINWDILPAKRNLWWFPFSKHTHQALLAALRFAFPRSLGEYVGSSLKLTPYLLKKMFTSWK
jgi:acyl-CoA reductase-like NAD-dependent aldehyde dehydrogenase